jgi:copper chaperone
MKTQHEEQIFRIAGMACGHCKSAVEEAIRQVPAVSDVKVDLSAGRAIVMGAPEAQQIVDAVNEAGYVASLQANA